MKPQAQPQPEWRMVRVPRADARGLRGVSVWLRPPRMQPGWHGEQPSAEQQDELRQALEGYREQWTRDLKLWLHLIKQRHHKLYPDATEPAAPQVSEATPPVQQQEANPAVPEPIAPKCCSLESYKQRSDAMMREKGWRPSTKEDKEWAALDGYSRDSVLERRGEHILTLPEEERPKPGPRRRRII